MHHHRIGLGMFALCLGLASSASAASDYQWTFNDNGFTDYVLTSVSSEQVFSGTLPANDPTINLIVGKRYEVTVVNYMPHPFEVLAMGDTAAGDTVILSMSGGGTLQSDAAINWTYNGAGVAEFTVTSALVTAMEGTASQSPGYRCEIHAAAMRGDFEIFGNGSPIADPIPEAIPMGSVAIDLEPVATGLASPLGMLDPGDGTNRVFVYDQGGTVTLIQNGTPAATPFLDVSNRLIDLGIVNGVNIGYDERGLLGMAFHPNFSSNGLVYTYTSEPVAGSADFSTIPGGDSANHQSVIAEWQVSAGDANVIDEGTRREILRVDQSEFNHNGGEIAFGPDGMLYIAFGDGGGADDQDGGSSPGGILTTGHGEGGNGSDPSTILGTIVRIDVAGSDSANGQYGIPGDNPFVGQAGMLDGIYAYGFRNPFRFSFDTANGDLYVADVGQNQVEEIDLVTAGGNYGWRLKEGSFYFDPADASTAGFVTDVPAEPLPAGLIDPIAEYDHDEGISIIGGYVYRGTDVPDLDGKYIFGDFGTFSTPTGRLFYLDTGNEIKELQFSSTRRDIGIWIKGMAQDSAGEVYVLGSTTLTPFGSTGVVYKLATPAPASVTGWMAY
ncbi:PQQ-dependent sugar dehydrogenase [bacterium]|nr:PQQ-dependent sugar dehydrogenase [bacterium]